MDVETLRRRVAAPAEERADAHAPALAAPRAKAREALSQLPETRGSGNLRRILVHFTGSDAGPVTFERSSRCVLRHGTTQSQATT